MGIAYFDNTVKVEWLVDDPRKMKLLEEINFYDSNGKVWTAPVSHIINGADIPDYLQAFIGTPYIGEYRRATVLHDVYCDTRTEPHRFVHKMFKEAMTVDGEDKHKIDLMYRAVATFGPKWRIKQKSRI